MKSTVLLASVVLLFPFASCHANLSGAWHPGQLIVDVTGVKEIAIVRERLRIDLRPLEQRGWIRITATYVIDYSHAPRDLPLTFITAVRSVEGVRCSVNRFPVGFTKTQVVNMPESWKPPLETPGFVPEETLLYSTSITDTQHQWISFTASLRTGKQTIEVTYEVEPGAYYSERYTAKFWQTAYILAPARTWKSFGGLDLEVLAPENWQVKCNLPLVNQGQQWTASFDTLPADFIALTTVHPSGKRLFLFNMLQSLYLFAVMTALLGLRRMLRRCQQLKQQSVLTNRVPSTNRDLWVLIFIAIFPLIFNAVSIFIGNSNVPSEQHNYQLFVIFVLFQGVYWLIPLALLLLISRFVLGVFCDVGTWMGNRSNTKWTAGGQLRRG